MDPKAAEKLKLQKKMERQLAQREIEKMSEEELQKAYISYLHKRLLRADERCSCGGRK